MAKLTKFVPVDTAKGWVLNIPAKYTQSGNRERQYFQTKGKALEAAKLLRASADEFGHQSQAIRPSLAEEATAADELLKPHGVSLLEAVRFYLDAKKTESASKPVDEALKLWICDVESRLRGKSVTNYKQTKKRLAELGDKVLATVTRDELQTILAPVGMNQASAAAHCRNGMAFWNWSARRGWCDPALFAKVDRPGNAKRKRIEFLEPEAAAALLKAAADYYPAAVGYFAVGLFAGVRPAELERLDPALVAADGIDVGADESNGESRRHISPSETLAAWLTKHPFQTVSNWQRIWDAVRRLAGWDVQSEFANKMLEDGRIAKLPPATRGAWSQDIMRHTCGTYTVALGEDLGGMAFWFGHTGGETTLRRFYVGKAKRKQALEFFAVMPKGVKASATIKVVKSRKGAA